MSEQRLIDKNEQEQIYVNSFSDEEMDDFASALNLVIETFCKFSDKHNFDRDNIIAFVAEKLQQFSEFATVKNYEVREQPAIDPVRHGKWISVKDRLPEGTGYYLIIYSREICRPEMAVAFFSAEDAEDCPYDTNYGFEYTTYGDHKDVLYWMPLPEMPMEENDKE